MRTRVTAAGEPTVDVRFCLVFPRETISVPVVRRVLGDTLYWLGDFPRALEHLEQGIALYRLDEHRALAHQHAGYDPCVACRSFSAYTLWYLGYPDRAVRRNEEAVALA